MAKEERLVPRSLAQNCGTRVEESASHCRPGYRYGDYCYATVTVDPPRLVKLDAPLSRLEPWQHNLFGLVIIGELVAQVGIGFFFGFFFLRSKNR